MIALRLVLKIMGGIKMKTTQEKIVVMQHYADGGEIICEGVISDDDFRPAWDWASCDYDIAKEPELMPYTYDTFPKCVTWVRKKGADTSAMVIGLSKSNVFTTRGCNSYAAALADREISTDNRKTWKAAGVEV